MKNLNTSEFDYIVIGSGAAGGIIASRLSENFKNNICLLESGPSNWHPYLHIPAGFIKVIFRKEFSWNFFTQENENTCNRKIPIPQGRVLGGSTSINGLVYNRGLKSDYDNWSTLGNEGWDYESILPYFKKNERRVGGDFSSSRGYDGKVSVTDSEWKDPICDSFIDGANQYGLNSNPDYNANSQEGVGYFQRTIFSGRRVSTAHAYIKKSVKNDGLVVLQHSQAIKIIIKDKRAVGVEYYNHRKKTTEIIKARKEVIISSGAINTPKLLQLSGIGDKKELSRINVELIKDLPGVGKNLKDHYSIRVSSRVSNALTINEKSRGLRLGIEIIKWIFRKPSILSLSPSVVYIFCKSNENINEPDLQGVFTPASYREGYVGMLDNYPGMTCGFWLHKPKSSGEVTLTSKDPFVSPSVQPNYLQDKEDQKKIIQCAKLARKFLSSEALMKFDPKETFPGEDCQTDQQLLDFCRRYGVSSYHLCGTAKMGPESDPMAVVTPRLKVRGIEGLRVVDSSVMPEIPSANICAATMMIAEKAADMIIEDNQQLS